MTQEQIERAAEECRRTTAQSMGVYGQYHSIDECPNHGISCDELVESSFTKGANWRINSVWHPINEDPGYGKYILVHFRSGNFTSWFASADILSDFKRFEAEGWAYVVDLLPADSE